MEDKKAPDAFSSSSPRPLRRRSAAAAAADSSFSSSSPPISDCRKRKADQDDDLVTSDRELLQIKRIRCCNKKLSKLSKTSEQCLQYHDRMEQLKKETLLLMGKVEGLKHEEEHCRRNLDAFLREFDAVTAVTTPVTTPPPLIDLYQTPVDDDRDYTTADTSFASHRPRGGGSDEDRSIQAVGWCSSSFYSAHRKRLAEFDEIYDRCARCHDRAAQLKKERLLMMALLKGMRQEKERCRLILDAYLRKFEAVAAATVPSLITEDQKENQEDDDNHYSPAIPTESSTSYKYSPAAPPAAPPSLLPFKKRGFHWH